MIDFNPEVIEKHLPLYNSKYRYNISKGGAGSGKSYSQAQIILIDLLTRNRCRWLALRKVGKDIKKSIYLLCADIAIENNITDQFFWNKTDMSIICKSTGNELYTSGLDDPERIKSITGITDVWMEEATEFTKEDWKQLTLRLRGKGIKRKFFLTFNPVSSKSWLKEVFYDRDTYKGKIQFIHSTYLDNPFLDDEYIDELESNKETDPDWYNVYVLNKWGSIGEHRILTNVIVHDFEIDDVLQRFNGGDFGFNDPNTLTECYIKDQELYMCYEWVKSGLDPEELKVQAREVEWIKNKKRVVCDNSRPEMIKMYNSPGRTFIAYPCRKNVFSIKKKGQYKTSMALYLKQFKKIHIHETNCPEAAKEFPEWSWQKLKDGTILDAPEDGYDHTIDAVIYSLEERARHYYSRNVK